MCVILLHCAKHVLHCANDCQVFYNQPFCSNAINQLITDYVLSVIRVSYRVSSVDYEKLNITE